jgi:hypothetical protein
MRDRVEGCLGRYGEHVVVERPGLDRLAGDAAEPYDPVVDKILTTGFEPGVVAAEADLCLLLAVGERQRPDQGRAKRDRQKLERAKKSHRQLTVVARGGCGMPRARPTFPPCPHESCGEIAENAVCIEGSRMCTSGSVVVGSWSDDAPYPEVVSVHRPIAFVSW